MSIQLRCRNVATGHINLVLGPHSINQELVDVIALLLNEKDLTGEFMRPRMEYQYNIETVSLVGRQSHFIDQTKDWGHIYFGINKIYVAPFAIATALSQAWIGGRLFHHNYAVNGTMELLITILHEATHSRVHEFFLPQGDVTEEEAYEQEEAYVIDYTNKQMMAFLRKYHLSFECLQFMGHLISDELDKDPVGKLIVQKQREWACRSLLSEDDRGMAILTVSQEYKKQYVPQESWVFHSVPVATGLEWMEEEAKETDRYIAMVEAGKVADALAAAAEAATIADPVVVPEPPVVVPAPPVAVPSPPPVVVPAPPATLVAPSPPRIVPSPPPTVPMPPEPPMSVYEEYNWMAEEAKLISAANKGDADEEDGIPRADLIKAIQQSPTYTQPTTGAILPTVGSHDVESIIQKVAYKIYRHIFTECGWDKDAATGFTNSEAVLKEVDLSDIPGVENYISFYHTVDERNKPCIEPGGRTVRGAMTGVIKLPVYNIAFKDGDKVLHRKFMPQNVNAVYKDKAKEGQPTYSAIQAKTKGIKYMWVMDPGVTAYDVATARINKERATSFLGKWENYAYFPIIQKGGK